MVRVGVVGVGKMGLSHLSMLRAHPQVELAAVCDSAKYVLDVLEKYTKMRTFTDYGRMLDEAELDAVVIATPTGTHFAMAEQAIKRGLHVFCEKPLTLNIKDSQILADLAEEHGVITQVGYHNRFVGAFEEAKTLLNAGAIGRVTHVLAESYGPVVLQPKGTTWRNRRDSGGGCLYDYAAHAIDLVNWYCGTPTRAGGTVFGHIFSEHTEDEVYSTLFFDDGVSAQLSVNWSDESYRKMTTKITLWGTGGRITVDRQECQVYLRETTVIPAGYTPGWNVKYTTELTEPVWFYLRGEEYSAELDQFVRNASKGSSRILSGHRNSFSSAAETDKVIDLLIRDEAAVPDVALAPELQLAPEGKSGRSWRAWTPTAKLSRRSS
ncbi:Gfo/Idh/MocA family oxidoreductase [Paeniglutamicibacter antarcticus]|uniref:Gfo/Idh/MocA family oxidoreductase n=1 Tax=Arthrobacter terrae TaxID=2935737 RepID=A0A931G368_9MICC|nr:Gfo/Idh/MocA family oxidoreductase [Arthrobacter terrae]MBG0738326.1 Gfo/Idh/MocA family oxidoreductase [Arthrobacter terrae]